LGERAEGWSYRVDDQSDWTEGLRDRYLELFYRGKRLGDRAQGPGATAPGAGLTVDERWMGVAVDAAERVRARTSPNPWVGAVIVTGDGAEFSGATAPAGGPHAEIAALAAAGDQARGGTLYVTLEPCAHQGRTPPCTEAIVAAGIRRVVVGMEDPDRLVAGAGITALVDAGLEVEVGVGADVVADQLAPYVCHRLTGRPWVVLKLAATLDGRTAAPDGTSQWLTGEGARADAHRLRSRSDAVLVGAGTVRADDPTLTVRLPDTDRDARPTDQQPLRIVLGHAPDQAKVQPAVELQGDLGEVLDELGRRGVIQLLVEGGPTVAHAFHAGGLVDRYVLYLAPALFGGDDALPLFRGPGAPTLSALWRGSVRSVTSLGSDLRVEMSPRDHPEQGE
jgi:diaminohydroxyphosphoribosylaminopyrimidine deaminase/5-amino-6-(5-phosphoribosylamino)uracil reductase